MSQKTEAKAEKTKKIKARVITEDGDLAFALIDVPVSDLRPEYKGESLTEKGVQAGKGPQD